jgi:Mitochondrial carrier protein
MLFPPTPAILLSSLTSGDGAAVRCQCDYKDYILGVSDYGKATWTQNFIASVAGAVASITVAAPLDAIKTRIHNAQKTSGVTIVRDLLRDEGAMALFKGLMPKVCRGCYPCLLRC